MLFLFQLGTDTAKLTSQNMQTMKYILRALPVVILPFTVNFPGAILCYWVCTNFISLGQVGFLRIPKVRDYFKIEKLLQHDNTQLPIQPKGFVKGVKECKLLLHVTNKKETVNFKFFISVDEHENIKRNGRAKEIRRDAISTCGKRTDRENIQVRSDETNAEIVIATDCPC